MTHQEIIDVLRELDSDLPFKEFKAWLNITMNWIEKIWGTGSLLFQQFNKLSMDYDIAVFHQDEETVKKVNQRYKRIAEQHLEGLIGKLQIEIKLAKNTPPVVAKPAPLPPEVKKPNLFQRTARSFKNITIPAWALIATILLGSIKLAYDQGKDIGGSRFDSQKTQLERDTASNMSTIRSLQSELHNDSVKYILPVLKK